jgi:hypothetical protein
MAPAQKLLGCQVAQTRRQFGPGQGGGLLVRLRGQRGEAVAGLAVTKRAQELALRFLVRLQRRRSLV